MAQPLIQKGDIASRLIEAFGIKGKSVAPTLGDLVHPIVMVEDLTKQSWYNQAIERPCGGANQLLAQVALFNSWQLFNPVGSGTVAIVDEIVAYSPSIAMQIFISFGNPAALTSQSFTTVYRDSVQLPVGNPVCQMRSDATAAAGPTTGILTKIATTSTTNIPVIDNPGFILAPGFSCVISGQTANQALAVSFRWRERYL